MPEGWRIQTLGNLADYVNGRAFKPNEWGEIGLPIIRIEQINNSEAGCDYFGGVITQDHKIDDGDLLFSWSATLTTLVWNRGPAALNQHIFKVLPKRGTDLDYLHHLLDFLIEQLAGQAHGSTMQHIKKSDLLPYLVHVPPLSEQRRIAAILDSADEAIEETEALIFKLKQAKAGLMHDLLTRGIDEHGHLRDPEANPEQFRDSPLGRIPRDWKPTTLGVACSLIKDGTHLPPKRVTEGPLLLSVQNMINGGFQPTKSDTRISWDFYRDMHRTWKIQPGDVLLAVVGATLGKTATVPRDIPAFTLQRSVAVFRGAAGVLENRFLYLYLSSERVQALLWRGANQTAQPGIYLQELAKLNIALPSIEEQQRIVEALDAHDERIRAEEAYRDKLVLQKRGLMDDLLTGRVRVGGGGKGSGA